MLAINKQHYLKSIFNNKNWPYCFLFDCQGKCRCLLASLTVSVKACQNPAPMMNPAHPLCILENIEIMSFHNAKYITAYHKC